MKKTIYTLGLCVSLILSTAAPTQAEQHNAKGHAEENHVDHYEAIKIESPKHALKVLQEKTKEIDAILLNKGELEFADLEAIHEISYTLENAIDYLRIKQAVEIGRIDIIDRAVQALHDASENQEEKETRNSFVLFKALVSVLPSFMAGTVNDNSDPVKK